MGSSEWDTATLHRHLQGVVDLELWTIPYYLTVLYSIKDPSSEPYRLIQAAVYQEMLHAQLASNIANAYGLSPAFRVPEYGGATVPHIDFDLDEPNPTRVYTPFSTALGPLDQERINTMCLVEYPEWDTGREPDVRPKNSEYGSIGEFYDAVRCGLRVLRDQCHGGVNQVDEFRSFYNQFAEPTVTRSGDEGYIQALTLLDAIVQQGEGQTEGVSDIPTEFQNTADGFQESWPHFQKFSWIRDQLALPDTYEGQAEPPPGTAGFLAQDVLIQDFGDFLATLEQLFRGEAPERFGTLMAKLGGDILTSWQRGAVPRFSPRTGLKRGDAQ